MAEKKYDAFLSHSSADTDAVEELAHWLMEQGVRVWFDEWELIPGEPWQEALEAGLRGSECCVVFVGTGGIKSWHAEEMRVALTHRLGSNAIRVVPALLPGSEQPAADEDLPAFLTRLHWVKLSGEDGRHVLLSGIRQESPGPTGKRARVAAQLESVVRRLDDARLADEPTGQLEERVLALKRELRQGQPPEKGDILGNRFRLGRMLGRGGFATVWKALDLKSKRIVAVKVLHGEWTRSEERRARFFRGARQMAKLEHPGIVRVLSPQEQDYPFHYFVMEYLDGGDFQEAVLEGMPPERNVDVVLKVGEALHYAHERGVIHRDVKPANILLSKAGMVKLTDFDLVRAKDTTGGTRTGALGTMVYAAPESMDDAKSVTAAVDVYSLGMTLLYGCIGRRLTTQDMFEPGGALAEAQIADAIKAVVREAIVRTPDERYRTAGAFVEALRDARATGLVTGSGRHGREDKSGESNGGAEDATGPTGRPEPPELDSCGTAGAVGGGSVRGAGAGRVWARQVSMLAVAGLSLFSLINWLPDRSPVEMSAVSPVTVEPFENPAVRPLDMVWIESGTFTMGSPNTEVGRWEDEGPQHDVTLSRGFYLSRTEVTQELYEAVMGENPSHFKEGGASRPIESVSWYDAVRFSNRLSELGGLEKCYEERGDVWEWTNRACSGYRLPTEAEWEYAARAGTTTSTYGGELEILGANDGPILEGLAWYGGNSGVGYRWSHGVNSSAWPDKHHGHVLSGTRTVRGKTANEWGLYDMLGNVHEWCWDGWRDYSRDAQLDPMGEGSDRVARGGSWMDDARLVRSAYRSRYGPSYRGSRLGFRLARGQEE